MIVLHIGRNKAASTSLQDFFAERHAELRAAGWDYFPIGHLKDADPRVKGMENTLDVVAYAEANPTRRLLISNEIMSTWPDHFTRGTHDLLRPFDVRILVYVRPYGDWMVSQYAEHVKQGGNPRDIDSYVEATSHHVSVLPNLSVWAEKFGWDKIWVRALDPRALVQGDVVRDCLEVLGLDQALADKRAERRLNTSLNWMRTEFIRAATDPAAVEVWPPPPRPGFQQAAALFQACMVECGIVKTDVEYLTIAQRRKFAAWYNEDMAQIGRKVGRIFPAISAGDAPERPFLPSIAAAPADLRAAFAVKARAQAWPTEVQIVLDRVLAAMKAG